MVTVYSKTDCFQCKLTERMLTQEGIAFKKVNIEEDAQALEHVKSLGYMQVPVVFVSDDRHWSGFVPDKINDLAHGLVAA